MPDTAMIEQYGDVALACAIFTHNYDRYIRNIIFSRHPALYMKRRAK